MTTKTINFRTNPEQMKRAHEARYALVNENTKPNYYKRAGMPKVGNLQLPFEVKKNFEMLASSKLRNLRNDYIVALVKTGWTAISVARCAGLSNEMVRQILRKHIGQEIPETLVLPEVPTHEARASRSAHYLPTPELLERLKKLQPFAQLVRSNSPKYRVEAEEYSRLIWEAHTEQKVTLYRLGKLLGVTTSALAFRLVRYGYKTTEHGDTKVYKPIRQENRAI